SRRGDMFGSRRTNDSAPARGRLAPADARLRPAGRVWLPRANDTCNARRTAGTVPRSPLLWPSWWPAPCPGWLRQPAPMPAMEPALHRSETNFAGLIAERSRFFVWVHGWKQQVERA